MTMQHRLRWLSSVAAALALGLGLAVAPYRNPAAHAGTVIGYRLRNDGSGKCLDVKAEDGANNPSASIQQYRCKDVGNQFWGRVFLGNGYDARNVFYQRYRLVNSGSGLCLDIVYAAVVPGAPAQQWYCNANSTDEQWDFYYSSYYGEYNIVARHSGLCLGVRDRSTDDHAVIEQQACDGTATQGWWVDAVYA